MLTITYVYRQRLHGYHEADIHTTTETDANSIDNAIKQTTNTYKTKRGSQLELKFENSRSYKQHHSNPNTWVKNISERPLTEQQTCVLAKGLN